MILQLQNIYYNYLSWKHSITNTIRFFNYNYNYSGVEITQCDPLDKGDSEIEI